MDFASRLESLIGSKPIYSFAREVGIPDPTIRSCLRRRSIPRMDVVVKIATETGVSLEWLATGQGSRYQGDEDIRARAVQLLDDPKVMGQIPPSSTPGESLEQVREGKASISAKLISYLAHSLDSAGMWRASEWLLLGGSRKIGEESETSGPSTRPIHLVGRIRRLKLDEGFSGRYRGYQEVRRLLENKEADPNHPGIDGVTPLMEAARGPMGDPELVEILLANGADVHARDDNQNTALTLAVGEQSAPLELNLSAVGVLLDHGADPLDKSYVFHWKSCLWQAKQCGLKRTLLLLEDALKERAYRDAIGSEGLQ